MMMVNIVVGGVGATLFLDKHYITIRNICQMLHIYCFLIFGRKGLGLVQIDTARHNSSSCESKRLNAHVYFFDVLKIMPLGFRIINMKIILCP